MTRTEWKKKLKNGFLEYRAGDRIPGAVTVKDQGTFFLGYDFDQALAVSGKDSVEALVVKKGSIKRADVVRNKIAAVTGGAQGFGEGIARRLAQEGAFVYILDMNLQGAEALAAELNTAAGKTTAAALEVNVTSEDSVFAMTAKILEITGGLDLFVNNAGVLKAGSVKS